MSISTIIQETLVDAVGSVVITNVTQDTVSGAYVRQIRVYSVPDPVTGAITLQYTLQVSGVAQSNIELTAPSAQF
jgi:hypothetical protein